MVLPRNVTYITAVTIDSNRTYQARRRDASTPANGLSLNGLQGCDQLFFKLNPATSCASAILQYFHPGVSKNNTRNANTRTIIADKAVDS